MALPALLIPLAWSGVRFAATRLATRYGSQIASRFLASPIQKAVNAGFNVWGAYETVDLVYTIATHDESLKKDILKQMEDNNVVNVDFFKENPRALDYFVELNNGESAKDTFNTLTGLFTDKDLSDEQKAEYFDNLSMQFPPEVFNEALEYCDSELENNLQQEQKRLENQLEMQKIALNNAVGTYDEEAIQQQVDETQNKLNETNALLADVNKFKDNFEKFAKANPNAQDTQVVDARGNVPLNEAEQMGQNIANRVQNKQELNAAERVYLLLGDNTMPYHQKAIILDAYFQRLSPQEKEVVAKQIADDVKQAKLDFHKASISVQQAELGQSKQDLSAQDERERQMLKDMDKDMAKNLDKAKDSMKTAENKLNYHSEKQALFDVLANYGNINKQAQAQNNAITEKANKDIASASGADSSAMDKLEANANKMPHPTNESVLDETQENRQVNKYRQA